VYSTEIVPSGSSLYKWARQQATMASKEVTFAGSEAVFEERRVVGTTTGDRSRVAIH
jgi:hypothetical protein